MFNGRAKLCIPTHVIWHPVFKWSPSPSVKAVIGLQSRICALKGSSVDLPCSTQHATSNISWYTVHTNGSKYVLTELSVDGDNGTYSMAKDNNFTLTIKVLREIDAKFYCCKETTENPQFCLNNQTELRVSGRAATIHKLLLTSVYAHLFYPSSSQSCR